MLDLRRDLYVRLVISAHKNKHLNKPFRVSHVDFREPVRSPKIVEKSPFEEKISSMNIPEKIHMIKPKSRAVEKIDEKVERIVNDPKIMEIKLELEFAEELLKKIKSVDNTNPKISIIEQTILRLRSMLDQKMYM